jgi:hypothetical protein
MSRGGLQRGIDGPDDPVRMRNGVIQINAAARLPLKEFPQ